MKKLWKENRVLLMLFVILIICFIAIISVALTFFYNKNVTEYGNRLDHIKEHEVSKDFLDKYENELLDNESISKVNVHVKGRIIYVNIDFKDDIELDAAKELVTKSLESFEEKVISYYDIEFILDSSNFTIIGAKNNINDYIAWNNNTEIPEEEEENEK